MRLTAKKLGWVKDGQWYTNPKYPFWKVYKYIYPGIHNPYSIYYTCPDGFKHRVSQEPTWFYIREFFLDTAKGFEKNPGSFKAVVGGYTCKQTGKWKHKTQEPFKDIKPRLGGEGGI